MDYFFAQISPAEAGDIDVLTEIPKQRLIEVHRQMEFFNADILIFSMNRGVLLLVNINGRKADHCIGKAGKPSCIRSRRENKGYRRRIGERLLHGLFDIQMVVNRPTANCGRHSLTIKEVSAFFISPPAESLT